MTTNVRATKSILAAAPAIANKVAASRSRLGRGARCMLLAALSLAVLPAAQAAIPASERAVLVALYNQTGGASWTNKTGWSDPVTGALGGTTGFECTWHGVTCDAGPNHVIQIYLQNNNLVGTLPSWSPLTALQYIVINYNTLTGGIPTLAGLTALTGVYVDHNQLTGSIPSLAGLTALQFFYVNNNQLTGQVPAVAGLTALKEFVVCVNQLTGSLPSLNGLSALQFFNAGQNQLTGSIPTLAGLTALQRFYVNNNQLTGAIPPLTGLSTLQEFGVENNHLTGSIPSLAGLTALQRFYVDDNQLTGVIPPLTGLATLQEFEVENNQLTGSIPSLAGLTALRTFYADDNKLTGTIPPLTGLLTLQEFDVGNNQLTGSVPSLNGLTALQSFYVYVNQLTGPMALPPSPSALVPGESNLCGNQLESTGNAAADQAWDVASGMAPAFGKPGWLACQGLVFGDQTVGTTSPPQTIILTATPASGTFTITSVTISGDFAQTNNCSAPLTPGTSCTINVTFTPTAVGLRTGSLGLTATFGAGGSLSGTASLQGNGVGPMGTAIPSLSAGGMLLLGLLVGLLGIGLARARFGQS